MRELRFESLPPRGEEWVSLHDMRIRSIHVGENEVTFEFPGGFDVVCDDRLTHTGPAEITMCCGADDFSCEFRKERPSRRGLKFRGRGIDLEELASLLKKTGKELEIYIEYCESNRICWRCDVNPCRSPLRMRRWERVEIEACGTFPVTYRWQEGKNI